jgi:hypothetical protein
MKQQMAIWGVVGMVISAAVFGFAFTAVSNFPPFVQNEIAVAIIFVFLLGLSVAEIPMMLYGLRLMIRNQTKSLFLISTFIIFISFASVYASIFVALTSNLLLGSLLAVLSLVRYGGGLWVK